LKCSAPHNRFDHWLLKQRCVRILVSWLPDRATKPPVRDCPLACISCTRTTANDNRNAPFLKFRSNSVDVPCSLSRWPCSLSPHEVRHKMRTANRFAVRRRRYPCILYAARRRGMSVYRTYATGHQVLGATRRRVSFIPANPTQQFLAIVLDWEIPGTGLRACP